MTAETAFPPSPPPPPPPPPPPSMPPVSAKVLRTRVPYFPVAVSEPVGAQPIYEKPAVSETVERRSRLVSTPIHRDQRVHNPSQQVGDRGTGDQLKVKGDQLKVEGDQLKVEGDQLKVEGDQLEVEGDQLEDKRDTSVPPSPPPPPPMDQLKGGAIGKQASWAKLRPESEQTTAMDQVMSELAQKLTSRSKMGASQQQRGSVGGSSRDLSSLEGALFMQEPAVNGGVSLEGIWGSMGYAMVCRYGLADRLQYGLNVAKGDVHEPVMKSFSATSDVKWCQELDELLNEELARIEIGPMLQQDIEDFQLKGGNCEDEDFMRFCQKLDAADVRLSLAHAYGLYPTYATLFWNTRQELRDMAIRQLKTDNKSFWTGLKGEVDIRNLITNINQPEGFTSTLETRFTTLAQKWKDILMRKRVVSYNSSQV
ncbi:hypothetical protein GNI_118890 [Gregarina niphandrodes]|uniref:Uncharacterized protein n=1 Tax=Gregarina niphandrodes TaxID=110365 RepID=A0A023B2J7_GRENI|nr:hypothetical protein GNI_118890 [Gregarina niphandrodes]EZG55062.1 hypothetical protein GNI_118890 [Gregarina niphandrodes]|eukprot:XP_011131805.1 hypothetical protein GNI_118890 [Gregarina niphandrodes]